MLELSTECTSNRTHDLKVYLTIPVCWNCNLVDKLSDSVIKWKLAGSIGYALRLCRTAAPYKSLAGIGTYQKKTWNLSDFVRSEDTFLLFRDLMMMLIGR